MKIVKLFVAVFTALNLTACASVFGDHNRRVAVNSNPKGAQVYLNGIAMNRTPTTVTVANPMGANTITLKKEGYDVASAQVNSSFQPVGALNVLFWPGFVVDAVTGDMKKLDTHNIDAQLNRTKRYAQNDIEEKATLSDA
jgi:hypothetical protein